MAFNKVARGIALAGGLQLYPNGVLRLPKPTVLAYVSGGTTNLAPSGGSFQSVTTATGNSSIAATAVPVAGQLLVLVINNDAGAARTITFTTNFRAVGTLIGTASKACTITFVSDGTNYLEISRVGAATATTGV